MYAVYYFTLQDSLKFDPNMNVSSPIRWTVFEPKVKYVSVTKVPDVCDSRIYWYSILSPLLSLPPRSLLTHFLSLPSPTHLTSLSLALLSSPVSLSSGGGGKGRKGMRGTRHRQELAMSWWAVHKDVLQVPCKFNELTMTVWFRGHPTCSWS